MSSLILRRFGLLAITLALSNPALVFAAGDVPEDQYESYAADMEFRLPGQEPVRLTNHFGREADPKKAIEEAAKIEKASGDGHVDIFLNEGEEAKLTPALRKEFEKYGLIVDPIIIPKGLKNALSATSAKGSAVYKYFFGGTYAKPTQRDWTLGLLMGTARTGISGIVWFSAPGVSHELAIAMTALYGFSTGVHAVYSETMQKWFLKGIKNPETTKGVIIYGIKDVIYTGALMNFMNIIGHGHIDPAYLLQFNISMLPALAIGSFNGAIRNRALRANVLDQGARRLLNTAYSLSVMPIFFALQGLENAGALSAWFKIGFYEVRPSIIATYVIYSSIMATAAYKPKFMINFLTAAKEFWEPKLSKLEQGFARVKAWFKRPTAKYCDTVLKKEIELPPRAAPPIPDKTPRLDGAGDFY